VGHTRSSRAENVEATLPKLYMVTMRHAVTLDMLAGGHILADSPADARRLAEPIFTDTSGCPPEMADRLEAKMAAGVVFGVHASTAKVSNALNQVLA
jgi:hypothetical protein